MKLCVVGLGYVGLISAAGFAKVGHAVSAWDNDRNRLVQLINGTHSTIEKGLPELINDGIKSGLLRFSTSPIWDQHEMFFICVGTSSDYGSLNYAYIDVVF